jgi:hypothetical protein
VRTAREAETQTVPAAPRFHSSETDGWISQPVKVFLSNFDPSVSSS